jgi:hypothetical protein
MSASTEGGHEALESCRLSSVGVYGWTLPLRMGKMSIQRAGTKSCPFKFAMSAQGINPHDVNRSVLLDRDMRWNWCICKASPNSRLAPSLAYPAYRRTDRLKRGGAVRRRAAMARFASTSRGLALLFSLIGFWALWPFAQDSAYAQTSPQPHAAFAARGVVEPAEGILSIGTAAIGVIERIVAGPGQLVHAGDELIKIDCAPLVNSEFRNSGIR